VRPDLLTTGLKIPGFGALELPAYFTGVTIGFVVAIVLLWRWAKRQDFDADTILDFGILMVVTGILGARILSVIADGHFKDYVHLCTDPIKVDWPISKAACMGERYAGIWDPVRRVCHPDYRDCLSWIKFWRGGLAFYGGLLLSIPAGMLYLKVRKAPVVKIVDAAGWAIPLGLGWGRIGCFLNGCCYGSVTNSLAGVAFPAGSQASLGQFKEGLVASPQAAALPVYPTQLFEAFIAFGVALLCYLYMRTRQRFKGETFLLFTIAYAAGRFVEEIFRRDDRGALAGLSTSQLIALASIAVAAALWALLLRRRSRLLAG